MSKKSNPFSPEVRERAVRMVLEHRGVGANSKLTTWGCGGFLGLGYAIRPKLSRYWTGLSEPSDTLIRSSLYQWM